MQYSCGGGEKLKNRGKRKTILSVEKKKENALKKKLAEYPF